MVQKIIDKKIDLTEDGIFSGGNINTEFLINNLLKRVKETKRFFPWNEKTIYISDKNSLKAWWEDEYYGNKEDNPLIMGSGFTRNEIRRKIKYSSEKYCARCGKFLNILNTVRKDYYFNICDKCNDSFVYKSIKEFFE